MGEPEPQTTTKDEASIDEDSGATIEAGNTSTMLTEAAIDHTVDGICAVGIVAIAITCNGSFGSIGALLSIALGKRVLKA